MKAAPVRARSHPKRRRRRLAGSLLALCILCGAAVGGYFATRPPDYTVVHFHGETVRVPKVPSLSPLRKRIVAIAESQLGYATNPPSTYCNKYSAYWVSGAQDCGNSNLSEEWCADFAAWVWKQAGADVTYQYLNGDLNSSAASFYEWGVARGTWHPAGSHYRPLPGDVAVYGLDKAALVAAHVAVVIGYTPAERGPIAVNGDERPCCSGRPCCSERPCCAGR
ncbi:MAG: CHAP domain-containing protein [Acidimicrobiales bacterium]